MIRLSQPTLKNIVRSSSLLLLAAAGLQACSSDPNCDAQTSGAFAIQIVIFDSKDCDYSGYVVLKGSDDQKQSLDCQMRDDLCTCIGGDDFGSYEVYIKDNATEEVDYGEFLVEPRAVPTCVSRETVKEFVPIEGGGGAGGEDGVGGIGSAN